MIFYLRICCHNVLHEKNNKCQSVKSDSPHMEKRKCIIWNLFNIADTQSRQLAGHKAKEWSEKKFSWIFILLLYWNLNKHKLIHPLLIKAFAQYIQNSYHVLQIQAALIMQRIRFRLKRLWMISLFTPATQTTWLNVFCTLYSFMQVIQQYQLCRYKCMILQILKKKLMYSFENKMKSCKRGELKLQLKRNKKNSSRWEEKIIHASYLCML